MIFGGRGASSRGRSFGPVWLGPDPVARGRLAAVAEGRVDPDVLRSLGASGPADAVIAAFERHGDAFPAHLHGEVAFALWDGAALRLGRDAFGLETLYHRDQQFSSDPADLGGTGRPDPVRIAEHLAATTVDASRTFDADIAEIPPGHAWRDGAVARWLDLPVDEDPRPADEIVASLRAELARAIRSRRPAGPVSVAVSGGLDSSAIVGFLRDDGPIRALTVRWDHPAADERRFVRQVVRGLEHAEVDGDEIDPFVRLLPGPPADPFAASTDALIRRASGSLFWGYDADNVVSMGFPSLADRVRRGGLASAWVEAGAVGRSYGLGAWDLLRDTAWPLLRPWAAAVAPPRWMRRSFLDEIDWDARVRALPRARSQQEDHRLALTHDDGRGTRLLVELARARGVRPVLPFMDVRLARRFLAVPSALRLGSGFDRILYRRALAGVVPEDVRWRRGKAMMTLAITRALHRFLPPLDAEPVAAFVDVRAVESLYERFRAAPSPADAWDLWRIMGLATWLRDRG